MFLDPPIVSGVIGVRCFPATCSEELLAEEMDVIDLIHPIFLTELYLPSSFSHLFPYFFKLFEIMKSLKSDRNSSN